MAKKITHTIPMIAAVNEVAWYEQEKDSLSVLSVKARWNLKKNMKALGELAQQFNEFRDNIQGELRERYTTDEMSDEAEVDDGNGNKVPGRKVKDEYLEEYNRDVNEMNAKLVDLLNEMEDVDLYYIDMDAEVENLPDGAELSDAAMDMLSLFDMLKLKGDED